MISFPNAKLNLGLNILSKREDGYHNISSCFIPVNWRDALEIIPSDQFRFTSSGLDIPGDQTSNLCVKAYEILKADFEIKPVHIHLHKVIPMGGGLGGGSADGTFTLRMLNEMFELSISTEQLQLYAKRLGADCPFFVENKPVLVSGIGELFEPVELDLKEYKIAVVNPGVHVPTKVAFSKVTPAEPETSTIEVINKPVVEWKDQLKNDFEQSVFTHYPEIKQMKESLYETGAVYASMTGSGASVYGLFGKSADLRVLVNKYGAPCVWLGE